MSAEQLGSGVWYGSEKGYIMLDVPDPDPQALDVHEKWGSASLYPKGGEYHCSLVAARKLAGDVPEAEQTIKNIVREYTTEHDLSFGGFIGDLYICRKQNDDNEWQTTAIAEVVVVGLDGLIHALRRQFPDFPTPMQHVTLLKTVNSPYGIGVNSTADLANYCTQRNDLFRRILPNAPVVTER